MYAIQCDLSGATGYAGCGCPPEHDAAQAAQHHEVCQLTDLHAVVGCAPECCDQHGDDGHDHEPKVCTAVHGACPSPDDRKFWKNLRSHQEDPDAAGMPVSARPADRDQPPGRVQLRDDHHGGRCGHVRAARLMRDHLADHRSDTRIGARIRLDCA
jgi:hypothetical protein